MAKTFNAGDVLAAADLNTNMMQPNTAGTGNRVVAGKTSFTITSAASTSITVNFGVTFTTLTAFYCNPQSNSAIPLISFMNGAPTTSSAVVVIGVVQVGGSGTTTTITNNLHWIAVGT